MQIENTAKAYIKGEFSVTPGGFNCQLGLFEEGMYNVFEGNDWELEILRRSVRGEKPYEKEKEVPSPWNEEKEEESLRRSRTRLHKVLRRSGDIVYKFVTLTYAEEPKDVQSAYRDLAHMAARIRNRFYTYFHYISSLDKSAKSGRLHFHLLVDCPFIDQKIWQEELWKKGIVDIRKTWKIKDEYGLNSLVGYMAKYICKKEIDHVPGSHRFNTSENFPDVSEHFRIYFNTYAEAEAALCRVMSEEYESIRDYTFEIEGDKVITMLYCWSKLPGCGNALFRSLAGLAKKGKLQMVKDALHLQTPSPSPVSGGPALPAKDSVEKLDTTTQLGLF